MADDARISTAFPRHPKTVKLQRRLEERGCWALVCLILWVADNRPDGDLSGLAEEDIEIAAAWTGDSGAFVACLLEVGFLDGEGLSYKVHDWAVHNPYVASRQQRVEAARQAIRKRWDGTTPEERSNAARHAANVRWERDREPQEDACDMPTECVPGERIMRTACVPPSLPFHAPHLSPPDHTTPKANQGANAPELPGWVPREEWFGFVEMRNKRRKPLTARAAKLIINKLDELRAAGNDPAAVLDQSTCQGWAGVFELKNGGGAKPPKSNGKSHELANQNYSEGAREFVGQ